MVIQPLQRMQIKFSLHGFHQSNQRTLTFTCAAEEHGYYVAIRTIALRDTLHRESTIEASYFKRLNELQEFPWTSYT